MIRGIAVLGSTGTIGANTLEIIRRFPDKFRVSSLSAGSNIEKLKSQIAEFRPAVAAVKDEAALPELRRAFPGVTILAGPMGLEACIEASGVDVVVMGIVGFAALAPTVHAVRRRKRIALANKESLVVAGSVMKREIEKSGAEIIPVDSEHNALFQLLEGRKRTEIASVVLTASGGPLLRRPELPLDEVTPAIAVKHPNWAMGPKISVDSATLMNKGLELIEAHYLFDVPQSQIEVWIHPQSIVHGAIWLKDNTCLAQLSRPDMKSSIGFAMGYPERLPEVVEKLSLMQMKNLEFFEPDTRRFPALDLARHALEAGPSHVITLNAGNEVGVDGFLRGELRFPQIAALVSELLGAHSRAPIESLEDIFAIDRQAREQADALMKKRRG